MTTTSAAPGDSPVPCIRCGYDLRGIDESSRCPECGFKAYWSTRAPAQLSEYPATWVTAVSRATRFLATAYGLLFLYMLLGETGHLPRTRWSGPGLISLVSIGQLIGCWMLARRSGHRSEPAQPLVRWLLRLTPIAMAIGSALTIQSLFSFTRALMWSINITMFIGFLAPAMVFVRLRTVARLIADKGLAEHSAIVGIGFLCTIGLMAAVFNLGGFGIEQWVLNWVEAGLSAFLLLFLLWAAYILCRCVVAFGRAARIARKQWKADLEEEKSDHARA